MPGSGVTENRGFINKGQEQLPNLPIPDYPFFRVSRMKRQQQPLPALPGLILTFGAVYVLGRIFAVRKVKTGTRE